MTIPLERSRAIRSTRNFLRDLLNPKKTPKVPKRVRQQAHRCLRHFPSDLDINQEVTFGGQFEVMEYEKET
jgi:hypothetical protein